MKSWLVRLLLAFLLTAPGPALALATPQEVLRNTELRDGLLPVHVDRNGGRILLSLPAPDAEGLSGRFIYVAALETGYRIGRTMVLREVLGQAPPGFSAATKTYCTEFEQRVATFCASVAGPAATAWDTDAWDTGLWDRVARNICYAPAYTIMGGTTNILRNILGERVLGLPREPRPTG